MGTRQTRRMGEVYRLERAAQALELDLKSDLEPAAEAAFAVKSNRYGEEGGVERGEIPLAGLVAVDTQITRIQDVEHFQEGGRRRLPHHEGLAQVQVHVQRRIVALAVAAHGQESSGVVLIKGRVPEAGAELEVVLVVEGVEARDDRVWKAGGPGHRRPHLPVVRQVG